MKKHEKEVYDALYKYYDKIIAESGCLDTDMELSKDDKGVPDVWRFTTNNNSGAFVFEWADFEVYATPYWECTEGLSYAIYNNGEEHNEGTLPLVITGDECADFAEYLRLVKDEIIGKCL